MDTVIFKTSNIESNLFAASYFRISTTRLKRKSKSVKFLDSLLLHKYYCGCANEKENKTRLERKPRKREEGTEGRRLRAKILSVHSCVIIREYVQKPSWYCRQILSAPSLDSTSKSYDLIRVSDLNRFRYSVLIENKNLPSIIMTLLFLKLADLTFDSLSHHWL